MNGVPGVLARVGVVSLVATTCTAAPVALGPPDGPGGPVPPCSRPSPGPGPAGVPAPPPREPLLATVWVPHTDTDELRWVDPLTLDPASDQVVPLGEQGNHPHSFLPGTSKLAIGSSSALHLVDTVAMEPLRTIPIRAQSVVALAWFAEDLLTAVLVDRGPRMDVVELDPATGEELERIPVDGSFARAVGLRDLLVLLVSPHFSTGTLGPSRLVVVDNAGGVRSVELQGIASGFDPRGDDPEDRSGVQVVPGLAVDPIGRRAFVVGDDLVAEIDLDRLTVDYHRPAGDPSLWDRLRAGFLPSAEAKFAEVSVREAVWVDGLLAVSGFDTDVVWSSRGPRDERVEPVGIRIIDTRSWLACTLDGEATEVTEAAGRLLGRVGFGSCKGGIGLVGYAADGSSGWHVLKRRLIDLQVVGRYAYATASCAGWHVFVVDLPSGSVVAEIQHRPPSLLSA